MSLKADGPSSTAVSFFRSAHIPVVIAILYLESPRRKVRKGLLVGRNTVEIYRKSGSILRIESRVNRRRDLMVFLRLTFATSPQGKTGPLGGCGY
jgi:hypothetical protein